MLAILVLASGGLLNAQPALPTHNWETGITRLFDSHYAQYAAEGEGYVQFGSGMECQRNYILASYVNEPLTIALLPLHSGFATMRWQIHRNGVALTGTGESYGFPNGTYTNKNDFDASNPIQFTPTQPGTYDIELETYENWMGTGIWSTVQKAYFVVIPKIEKVWIETDPICAPLASAPSDNKIHFRIKTYPDIASVMHYEPTYQTGVNVTSVTPRYCARDERLKIGINVKVNADNGGSYFDVFSNFSNVNGTASNDVKGSLWASYNTSLQNDFWAYYVDPGGLSPDLEDYINGTHKGASIKVDLTMTDGISLNTTLSAPIIVNYAPSTAFSFGLGHSAYHSETFTVPSNATTITWTPQDNPAQKMYGDDQTVYKVWKSITIPAGRKLIIEDMQIELGPNAQIYVETAPGTNTPGGYLKLNNSTVTSLQTQACGYGPGLWKGVQVWGDATQYQGLTTIGSFSPASFQGTLEMTNGSIISNANWAVVTSGPDLTGKGLKNGGVVIASNSSFVNNVRSVGYATYPVRSYPAANLGKPYRSVFANCDFEVNSALPGSFIGFIAGDQVKGVQVLGSRFRNNNAPTASGFNLGIHGWDFGVNVNQLVPFSGPAIPSEFENLAKGIEIKAVAGTAGVHVRNSEFANNTFGVRTDAMPAPIIRNNDFMVQGGSEPNNGVGVYINTGSGYDVSFNSFVPMMGSTYNTGVLIQATGADNNVVHSNTYQGIWCANLSNMLNRHPSLDDRGLQFLCNNNSLNAHDLGGRSRPRNSGNSPYDGMRGWQGNQNLGAGNSITFSPQFHIYNYLSEVQNIEYYYNSGQMPVIVVGSTITAANGDNSCDYVSGDNNGGGGGKGPTDPSGTGPRLRIAYFLNDPPGMEHRDSLYLVLADWQSPYSDLLKTDLLIEDADFTAANSVYNSIVSNHQLTLDEADEFAIWGRRLMDIGIALKQDSLSMKDLNSQQVQDLEGIADSATMWAQRRAQAWLNLYDERQFSPDYIFLNDTSTNNNQRRVRTVSEPYYRLSPNPANHQINISFQKASDVDQVFLLLDITGRTIVQKTLYGQSGLDIIDIQHHKPGMYLYKIVENGTVISTGKIIKE